MNKFLHKVFTWLWMSSSDPTKVGLSAKGLLTTLVGVLIPALGLVHVNVGPDIVNGLIDNVSIAITALLTFVGSVGLVFGSIRKIWVTFRGQHPLLNAPVSQ